MTYQLIKNPLGTFVNKVNENWLKDIKKIKKEWAFKIAHILTEKIRNDIITSRRYKTKRSQEKIY